MNRNRETDIARLWRRPKGGVFEPRRDSLGRESFSLPEVRSLADLSMMPDEDARKTPRVKPGGRSGQTGPKALSA